MLKKSDSYRRLKGKINVIIIAILALVLGWQGDFEGGDIAASRSSFLGDSPIDIWGSFSGFFYGSIPNQPIPWGLYLYLFQILLTVLSLLRLQNSLIFKNSLLARTSFYIFSYLFLSFSTSLTRDSTLACCILFGISIISQMPESRKPKIIQYLIATIFIAVGISFRPWIVLVTLFIFYCLTNITRNKRFFPLLILLSLFLPFIFNASIYSFTNMKKVHPELQVMIMDGGSMACLSSYELTRERATRFLNDINGNNYSNEKICSNFRLNTWTTLGNWQPTLKELNIIEHQDRDYKDKRTPIIFIKTNISNIKYEKIRNAWVGLISNNYKDYFRIKVLQFNQLLLLGDTSRLRFLSVFKSASDSSIKSVIAAIFFAPWDVLIYFHLLAPLPIIFVFSLAIICFMRDKTIRSIIRNKAIIFPYGFMFTYLIFSTLAYIGDTGRYMYLPSLIFWYFLTVSVKRNKTYEK